MEKKKPTQIMISDKDKEYMENLCDFDNRKKSNLVVQAIKHYGNSIGYTGDNNDR